MSKLYDNHTLKIKLDDGWPESEKDVFQAALSMVVVKKKHREREGDREREREGERERENERGGERERAVSSVVGIETLYHKAIPLKIFKDIL